MGTRLRQGLSYCLVDDRPVFLDILADRYFVLSAASSMRFMGLVDEPDRASFDPEPAIAGLFELYDGPNDVAPTTIGVPQRDVMPRRAGFSITSLSILSAHASAWLMLRTLPLHKMLRHVSGTSVHRRKDGDIAQCAAAFRASDAIVARTDRCLLKAIAMSLYLRRSGFRAQMVFGVTLDPFRAHCWLQDDTLLLNESYDIARNFTPILVVR